MLPNFFSNFAGNKLIDIHVAFITVFPYSRPYTDILCGAFDDTYFTYHHGAIAHTSYHWYGVGGSYRW